MVYRYWYGEIFKRWYQIGDKICWNNTSKLKCHNISHDIIGNLGWCEAGACFTNGFSIAIQIDNFHLRSHRLWRIDYGKILTWDDNCACTKIVVIWWQIIESQLDEFSFEIVLRAKRSLMKWARDQRKLIFKMISNHNRTGDFVIQWMWLFIHAVDILLNERGPSAKAQCLLNFIV